MCTINVLKFVLKIPHYFVCESFYKLTKNFYNESGSQPEKNHWIDQDINKQKGHGDNDDDDDDDDDDLYIMVKCMSVCNVFDYFKKCLETGETTKFFEYGMCL